MTETNVAETDTIRVLELAESMDAANSLQRIASTAALKEDRKSARAALYRLSLKGIKPDRSASFVIDEAPKLGAPSALRTWASAFDGAGNRLLFVAYTDPGCGKPTLLQFLVNDEQGISSFDCLRLTIELILDRVRMFEEQLEQGLALAEVAADYGRWLVHLSRERTRTLGKQSPPESLPWYQRIGPPAAEYKTAPVWSTIDSQEIRTDDTIDRNGRAVFEIKWYDAWFFSAADADPWTRSWASAQGRDHADSDAISVEQEKVLDSAVARLMTIDMREFYARRLEETAHILLLRNQVSAARHGLYHALELRAATDIGACSFARALVRRSIEAVLELRRQQESVETPDDPS